MDEFPIINLPSDQVDYRWGRGSPEFENTMGRLIYSAYSDAEDAIISGRVSKGAYRTWYNFACKMKVSIEEKGLVNPLIVHKVPDGKYLTLVGNSRLCVLRILEWKEVPCRITELWGGGEREVWQRHSYEAVEPYGVPWP